MTTYYCNKSGNDSNSGLSAGAAFLSLGAARTAASSGDDIIVGAGVYHETVLVSGGFPDGITFKADGLVVMDGQGVLDYGFQIVSGVSNAMTSFIPLSTGSGFVFRGFITAVENGGFTTQTSQNVIRGCVFRNNLTGYWPMGRTPSSFPDLVEDCAFIGNSQGVISSTDGLGFRTIKNCTFYNNNFGFFRGSGGGRNTLDSNVFHNGTHTNGSNYMIYLSTSAGTLTSDYNDIYFDGTGQTYVNGTISSTLAAYQAAVQALEGASNEVNSIDTDPLFLDGPNHLLRLQQASPARTSSSTAGRAGAYPGGIAVSNNVDSANWTTSATLTNLTINANGAYELTAPGSPGTIETGVLDAGVVVPHAKINVEQLINYPSQVIDHDETDTSPNRLTVEARGGASPGAVTAAAYQPVDIGGDLSAVIAGPFQYWQVKATLRNNGVSA